MLLPGSTVDVSSSWYYSDCMMVHGERFVDTSNVNINHSLFIDQITFKINSACERKLLYRQTAHAVRIAHAQLRVRKIAPNAVTEGDRVRPWCDL